MVIQLVTEEEYKYNNYKEDFDITSFKSVRTFDNYDINIIDLTGEVIWKNIKNLSSKPVFPMIKSSDFESLNSIAKDSKDSKIIYVLPQNIMYNMNFLDQKKFAYLKDILGFYIEALKQVIPFKNINLKFGNNETMIGDKAINSAFYFYDDENGALTFSKNSNKVTTINNSIFYVTTIDILNGEVDKNINDYLKEIKLVNSINEYPDWLYLFNYNDDSDKKLEIEKAKEIIKEQKEIIENSNNKLKENLRYKSILVTNSNELVDVVFELIETIFDVDLTDFIDKKREDFLFKKDGITYIGEIKGVTSNIKYEHLSQLNVHYAAYLDELQESNQDENIKKILIMNYERNKNISDRDEINEMQINMAKREQILIIDTLSLLKINEMIINKNLTKEQVISIINNQVGLIEVK